MHSYLACCGHRCCPVNAVKEDDGEDESQLAWHVLVPSLAVKCAFFHVVAPSRVFKKGGITKPLELAINHSAEMNTDHVLSTQLADERLLTVAA